MSFVKKLATADDQKEFKEKFGISLCVGDSFVINGERDCLLHSPRQDRWDMGGTTNTYWDFTYQNQNLIVACGIGIRRDDKTTFHIPITSIRKDDYKTEITEIDDNFIASFSDAYHIYDKYYDHSNGELSASAGNQYKFKTAGSLS